MKEAYSIDFNKSVYELCRENPRISEMLQNLGFKDITKTGMMETAGRIMTIPKGAAMKKISLDYIKDEFIKEGYEIVE